MEEVDALYISLRRGLLGRVWAHGPPAAGRGDSSRMDLQLRLLDLSARARRQRALLRQPERLPVLGEARATRGPGVVGLGHARHPGRRLLKVKLNKY